MEITKNEELFTELKSYLSENTYNALTYLVELFSKKKAKIYLVGGCVRDLLLAKKPKDIDLCTNLEPKEMVKLVSPMSEWSIIETGMKHGTVTFHNKMTKDDFEVTTFRVDGEYTDHRHPDEVVFTKSLEEDLKRRDLTINSFAYNLATNELYMLDKTFIYDLECGVIRCVGNPEDRFTEDALRMLRAIRFAAQLGFSLDSDTFDAIMKLAPTITNVSKERIRDELAKILMSDYPQMLELLSLTGLDKWLEIPVTQMLAEPQCNKYHYTDVFHHTMDVIKGVKKDFELRWAAFMHDWGKMKTVTVDDEGWEHYYGHPKVSAEMAEEFMLNYKFDNESLEHIKTMIKYHDQDMGVRVKMPGFKRAVNRVGEDLFPKFLQLVFADRFAHRLDDFGFSIYDIDAAKQKYIDLKTKPEPMCLKDLAVNGDTLKKLGFEGKAIGDTLKSLMRYVIEHPEDNNEDTLTALAITIKNGVEYDWTKDVESDGR